MTRDEIHSLYRLYHKLLSAERWPDSLERSDKLFRSGKSGKYDVVVTINAIRSAHRDRCNGKGSPQKCDDALKEALKL